MESKFLKSVVLVVVFSCFHFSKAEPLTVVSATPRGDLQSLRDAMNIVVTFSRPMVPLRALPQKITLAPLSLDPSVSGTYRWLGSRTLVFVPTDTLPYATTFRITVPAGTRSLKGDLLPTDYAWTFTTPRPQLVASYPKPKQRWVAPDTVFYLHFNQPMSPERASGGIVLLEMGTKETIPLHISRPDSQTLQALWWPARDRPKTLRLQPDRTLSYDMDYQIILKEGLLGVQGDQGLAKEVAIPFRTLGPLTFVGFGPSAQKKRRKRAVDPDRPLVFRFSNPVSAAQLVQHIHFRPPVQIPEYYRHRDWEEAKVYLSLPLQPDMTYRFTIDPELRDRYGNTLGVTAIDSFRTGSLRPRIIMTTGQGVVEADGERRYPVEFINQARVRVEMGLVQANTLIPLLTQKRSLFYRSEPLPANLFSFSQDLSVPVKKNEKVLRPVELDEVLKSKQTGLVLLQISGEADRQQRQFYCALLQITHLGISAKFSPHNNVIMVTTLKDAMPVAGARVEIRDDHNRVLWSGTTDSSGVAETPGWRRLNIRPKSRWEKPRQWALVFKGNDFAYIASDQGRGIEPYRFDVPFDWKPEPVKSTGIIFTDRQLYRAGETVHLKGMLREKTFDRWQIPTYRQLVLKIRDARGKVALDENVPVSEFGSFQVDFDLKSSAPLGYYSVSAETLRTDNKKGYARPIAHGNFRVEAFRPAKFKVEVHSDRHAYIQGDSVTVTVNASYLFGAPLSRQKVALNTFVFPTSYRPKGHEDYIFGVALSGWEETIRQHPQLAHEQTMLDHRGYAALGQRIKTGADVPLELVFSADVESPDRQHIAGSSRSIVHPAQYYVGLKPSTGFIAVNERLTADVIAVTPDGRMVGGQKVKVRILRRQWHSVRKAGLGGRYHRNSKKVDTVVDSMVVVSQASRVVPIHFTPESAGVYFIEATVGDGRGNVSRTETWFYATGRGYVAWERRDDDRIELLADAASYAPGDTARIMIQSPFESARALVTIEREGIFSQRSLLLDGSTPTIRVPIIPDYLPNIFVSVILLQGRTDKPAARESEDIGRPAFKMGYINLPVDPASQRLHVAVHTAKESYRPGAKATVRLHVADHTGNGQKAEVTLAVVDAGVLNLVNYQLPDPFATFYGQRPLAVLTAETRLHVVEQRNYGEKGENPGGGGGELNLAGMDVRRLFEASAYWNPSIITDAHGKAEVTFRLPDNLTEFRIMAVAQSLDSKFGRGSANIQTQKPLMLQPALPRFVRVGDEFEGGVVLHNYTGKTGRAKISVQARGVDLAGKDRQSVRVTRDQTVVVHFHFRAMRAGRATFRFGARLADETDAVEITIPVRAVHRKETVALYRRTEGATEEQIEVPKNVWADSTALRISLSATALSTLDGPVQYLVNYPYECLEQRLSRILPFLVARDVLRTFAAIDEDRARDLVTKTLNEMEKFKNYEGGFSLWPDAEHSWPYPTAYAAFTLTLAQKAGYRIDKSMLSDALTYLRGVLTEEMDRSAYPYTGADWQLTDLMSLYVLTLNGRSDAGYVERFYQQRQSLPLTARAYLLKTLHLMNPTDSRVTTLAGELSNRIRLSPTTAYFESDTQGFSPWVFPSNTRATAILLQALVESGQDVPYAEKVLSYLFEKRRGDHWNNTQENFYVVYALATFFEKYESQPPQFRAWVEMSGREIASAVFTGYTQRVVKKRVPLSAYTGRRVPLRIMKRGPGSLYYGFRLSYYPMRMVEPREEGLTVLKSIEPVNPDTGGLAPYQSGQLLKVTVQVVTPFERTFVVVDDPLPAGFEPVNLNFATTALSAKRIEDLSPWWSGFSHVEAHDDRVLLFADFLSPGLHSYTYIVRAITPGRFAMPAAQVEEMYSPEVFGRNVDQTIEILP